MLAITTSIFGYAQNTNPLNYSGLIYVEAIEIYSTPRYVSYEDHAILSQRMRIPSAKISRCNLDFEKGIVTVDEKTMKIKVLSTKKYSTAYGWVVVIYMDLVNEGNKAELVWPEFGKPYLQQITPKNSGVDIARMVLSQKPYVASEEEAMMNILMGLGTM
jgi:hypothetical protein